MSISFIPEFMPSNWEYTFIGIKVLSIKQKALQLGKIGWEMVGCDTEGRIWFKRLLTSE